MIHTEQCISYWMYSYWIMRTLFCVFFPQYSVEFAFDAANMYARTLEPFRLFYKENESLDTEALKEQEHGTDSTSLLASGFSLFVSVYIIWKSLWTSLLITANRCTAIDLRTPTLKEL